jgi:hypothetical protein
VLLVASRWIYDRTLNAHARFLGSGALAMRSFKGRFLSSYCLSRCDFSSCLDSDFCFL